MNDPLRHRSESGKVAPGIDQTARQTVLAQHVERAVDGKALGDAAEIDPGPAVPIANAAMRAQFDRARGRCASFAAGGGSSTPRGSRPWRCSKGATVTSKTPDDCRLSSIAVSRT